MCVSLISGVVYTLYCIKSCPSCNRCIIHGKKLCREAFLVHCSGCMTLYTSLYLRLRSYKYFVLRCKWLEQTQRTTFTVHKAFCSAAVFPDISLCLCVRTCVCVSVCAYVCVCVGGDRSMSHILMPYQVSHRGLTARDC